MKPETKKTTNSLLRGRDASGASIVSENLEKHQSGEPLGAATRENDGIDIIYV